MARFSAGVGGQSTLKLQLTAPPSGRVEILAVEAFSEIGIGTCSRPVLLRPLTAGIGTANNETIQPFALTGVPVGSRDRTLAISNSVGIPVSASQGVQSQCVVVTDFTTPPSLPIVINPTYAAPLFTFNRLNPGKGIIVNSGESIILYAVSSQLEHTWNGRIEWEEL